MFELKRRTTRHLRPPAPLVTLAWLIPKFISYVKQQKSNTHLTCTFCYISQVAYMPNIFAIEKFVCTSNNCFSIFQFAMITAIMFYLPLSLKHYLSLSHKDCLSLSLSTYLSLPISLSFFLSLFLSLYLPLSLSFIHTHM